MKTSTSALCLALALVAAGCGQQASTNQQDTTPKQAVAGQAVDPAASAPADQSEALSRTELRNLMSESDYIARVKLTQLGDQAQELKILANYKGSLSNIEFDMPKGLSPNTEYLLFYHDDEEGNVVPTTNEMPAIAVAPENDTILDYVRKTYNKDDETSQERADREAKEREAAEKAKESKRSESSEDKDSEKTTKNNATKSTSSEKSSSSKSTDGGKTSSKSTTEKTSSRRSSDDEEDTTSSRKSSSSSTSSTRESSRRSSSSDTNDSDDTNNR